MKPCIGIFTGSFDPFHHGHLQAIECALKTCGLHKVILFPDQEPNRYKPDRSPWKHRLLELRDACAKHKQIQISQQSPKEVYQDNSYEYCGILGADNYLRRQSQGQGWPIPLSKWIIIRRESAQVIPFRDDCQVITPSLLGVSSGQLRQMLVENPEQALPLLHPRVWARRMALQIPGIVPEYRWHSHGLSPDVVFPAAQGTVVKAFSSPQRYRNEILGFTSDLPIHRPRLLHQFDKEQVLVMEDVGGIGLNQCRDPEVFERAGQTLTLLHAHGWQHGDASVNNMIWFNDRLYMIDWAKCDQKKTPEYEYCQFISSIQWKLPDAHELISAFRRGYSHPLCHAILKRMKKLWHKKQVYFAQRDRGQ